MKVVGTLKNQNSSPVNEYKSLPPTEHLKLSVIVISLQA